MKYHKLYQTLAFTVCILHTANAGKLIELYEADTLDSPSIESAEFSLKAAEQRISTEKKNYLPRISANAKELWVDQDIKQRNTSVFQDGRDGYGNTRAKVELDQPLIDLTIKPKVEAAKSLYESRQHLLEIRKSEQTQRLLDTYIEASQYYGLLASHERVIKRLESELTKVSKSFEEKLATVEDLENVKAALSAMRQEKRIHEEKLKFKLLDLGVSPENIDQDWVTLAKDANLNNYAPAEASEGNSHLLQAVQAEVTAYTHQISALKRKELPRLSLYGLYQHDDADGSQFGGERRLTGYEVGVSLDWNIFDRGISRSEAKELYYLKRAKEADLRILAAEEKREEQIAELSTKLAQSNLDNLKELIKHQDAIREAAERAYESGGNRSYINMVNAFLIYESQVRQYIVGQHAALSQQINSLGNRYGWNHDLVTAVDQLFVQAQ